MTEVAWLEEREPVASACGPASFAETVAGGLAGLGYPLGLSQDRGATPDWRTLMDTLDGNAIAGLLNETFGEDMTGFMATCAACGVVAAIAESVVYPRLPGAVARCRSCGALLMVITRIRGVNCLDLQGIAALTRPGERPSRLPLTGSSADLAQTSPQGSAGPLHADQGDLYRQSPPLARRPDARSCRDECVPDRMGRAKRWDTVHAARSPRRSLIEQYNDLVVRGNTADGLERMTDWIFQANPRFY